MRPSIAFISLLFCLVCFGKLSGEENYWARADFLYWKAHEKSFVLTNKTSPVFTTDDYTQTKVLTPHFDWDPGVRLGVGYHSCDDCWDTAFYWTHYHASLNQKQHTDNNDLTNVNDQLGMFPIWSLSDDIIAGDYASDARLQGKLSLDLYDLNFGCNFYCMECLQIQPYVGLRGAYIRQSAHVKYSGGIFLIGIIDGGVQLNGTDLIHLTNNFWGVGPRVGVAPEWYLGQGFSIYGDAAISGLLGKFNVQQKETFLENVRSHHKKNFTRFRYVADFSIGLEWNCCLCDIYDLCLRLGYEYHFFYHQLELKQDAFHLVPHNRNLDIQGISASLGIGF